MPLGEGMVNFWSFLSFLHLLKSGPIPPVTMHFEYPPLEMDGGGDDAARRRETREGMRRDLDRFRTLVAKLPESIEGFERPHGRPLVTDNKSKP